MLVLLPHGSNEQFIGFLESLGVEYRLFGPSTDIQPATTLKRKIQRHWRKWQSERAMLSQLEAIGLDNSILHVDLSPQQSMASLVKLCQRTKVFITLHNALPAVPGWRKRIWKYKFQKLSGFPNFNIFCSNEDAKRFFSRFVRPEFQDRMRVTYTSVNPPEIDAALSAELNRPALLERFGIAEDKLIVLAVGQFIDRKGRWTFLDAAAAVKKVRSDVQFVWLTPELPNAEDQQRIDKLGLGDSFRTVRSNDVGTERGQILQFFRLADIFALPSFVEGLPIALLEAMALGIASISTNINGIPEAVIDGQTGILIEAGDSAALAAAIARLADDEGLRMQLAEKGREFALERFDERVAALTALAAYKESLSDGR